MTLQDIADRLKMGRSTVCSALRGTGTLAQKTREKIQETAQEMGYEPNLHAAALAERRASDHKRSNREFVAVLHYAEPEYRGIQTRYDDKMRAYVGKLGLDFAGFNLKDYPNAGYLARILKARGFSGILLDRIMREYDFSKFPWDAFSVVCVGRQTEERPFDMVRESMSETIRQALKLARLRGYQKPGVCLFRHPADLPDDHARIGEALFQFNFSERMAVIPPFIGYPGEGIARRRFESEFTDWFSNFKPDVVIGFVVGFYYNLVTAGWRLPEDAGFLSLIVDPSDEWQAPISGFLDPTKHITYVAMDRMSFLIRHGRKGIPERKLELLLNAEWWEGSTLPDKTND